MNKFDNYIFLSIAEVTVPMFSKSNFTTYTAYCRGMRTSLNEGKLSYKEKHDLLKLGSFLSKVYALNSIEIGDYIIKYFDKDNHGEFYRLVIFTNEVFPFTGDDKDWDKKLSI